MPLTIFKRGKVWHYRGTVGPPGARRKLRGSCRTTKRADAERFIAEKDAREWKRGFDGPAAVLTFAQAAILYRAAGKTDRFLRTIAAHWRDTPIKEISASAVRQAAIELYPHAGGATRNRQAITPTQAVINHAAEMELCPRIKVKRFPSIGKQKKPTTWPWVEAFMRASSPHLGALACFMFLTGARITEALSLNWSNVDLSASRALIRQTKIGTERWTHLPTILTAAMANIAGPRKGRVFCYSSRQTVDTPWRYACRRAGIPVLSPHCCRHGFATAALQAGIDVVTVAKLGGWESPRHVFETYGHASDDITLTDRLVGTQGTQASQSKRKVIGE